MSSRWFVPVAPRPAAARRLYCLPYAGAGPSAFRAWGDAFGPDIDVQAVLQPGREGRFTEDGPPDQRAVAAAIADHADRPFAIYGHSFGGRFGFEVARELRAAGATLPLRLYPSASRPPHVKVDTGLLDGLAAAPDDELIDALTRGGGMPPAVLEQPELLELVLPAVRMDLGWLDDYDHQEQAPLPVPITGFAGSTDRMVSADLMTGWERHTDAGFTLHELTGGHFFIAERLSELAALIRADLTSADPKPATSPRDAVSLPPEPAIRPRDAVSLPLEPAIRPRDAVSSDPEPAMSPRNAQGGGAR